MYFLIYLIVLKLQNFGSNISKKNENPASTINKIGNKVSSFGSKVSDNTPSKLGDSLRKGGMRNVGGAVSTILPTRQMSRNRYRER